MSKIDDLNLKEILDDANEIQKKINYVENLTMLKTLSPISDKEIFDDIQKVALMIKKTQAVTKKLVNIYNYCNNSFRKKIKYFKKEQDYIDPYPKNTDWLHIHKKNINKENSEEVVPGIPIRVEKVETIENIPHMPLYWVKTLNQFAFNLNGVVFRGNIGNIYFDRINQEKKHNVYNCSFRVKNKNICNHTVNKKCKYYHDPLTSKSIHSNPECIRNFINSSFLYTNQPKTFKNKYMRHIGNRKTLKEDLEIMQLHNSRGTYKEEIDIRQAQSIHDVLIILAMNQYDLLEQKF